MRLKSLKLAGFKSFANPTTFTFKHDITAIVGPNGCGKSNVIDAIRWVLGETSAKQLRGGAMSDVIFAGVEGRAAKSLASVELIFEHTQDETHGIRHELNLYQELSLRRQVTKDGKSDYFINGQRVRRRDVVDVFLGTGLGARSYAVIEQGMIGRIVESSPMQLREFIEEAAGVSRYQVRRADTEKKLAETRDNLERLSDLQGELKKQQKTLIRQAESAKQYQALNDELQALHRDDLVRRLFEAWQYHELKKGEHGKSSDELAKLEMEVTRVRRELDTLSARVAEGQWLKDEARDKYHNAQMAEQTAQHNFYTVNSELAQSDEKITRLTAQHQEALANIEHATAELAEIDSQLATITPDMMALEQALTDAKQALADAQEAWQKQRDELSVITQDKNNLDNRKKLAESQIARLKDAEQKWQKRSDALDAEQASFVDIKKEHAEQKTYQEQIANLKLKLDNLSDHDELKSRYDTLSETVKTLQASTQSQEKRHAVLMGEYDILHKLVHTPIAQQNSVSSDDQADLQALPSLEHGLMPSSTGHQYAKVLDQFLGFWLDAKVTAQLNMATALTAPAKDGVNLLLKSGKKSDTAITTSAIAASDAIAKLPKQIGEQLIRLDQLFSTPTLEIFGRTFLYTGDDALDEMDTSALIGVMILTKAGWLIGSFGMVHISRFGETGSQFLAQKQAHIERLAVLEEELNTLEDALNADQKQLKNQLNLLEQTKVELEEVIAQKTATTAQLHSVEKALTALTAKLDADKIRRDNHAKNRQALDEEKQDRQKELDELTAQLDEYHTKLGEFAPRFEMANQAMTVLTARIDEANRLVKTKNDAYQAMQLKFGTLSQSKIHAERLLDMAKNSATQTIADIEVTKKHQETLQEKLPKLEEIFKAAKMSSHELKISSDEYEAAAKALQIAQTKLQDELTEVHGKFATAQAQSAQISADVAVGESRMQDLGDELLRFDEAFNLPATLAEFRANPNQQFIDHSQKRENIKAQIAKLGAVNLAAAAELAEIEARVSPMDEQIQDITDSMKKLEDAIKAIDEKTKSLFLTALNAVNKELNALFSKVFGGGQASLSLMEDDTLSKADKWRAGLVLMAQPKGKKNSRLAVLSGGEKTLTALSLIFAIFKQHPAPFCVLDEVDAPLDDANVGRFTGLIHELADDVQFIFISHNKLAMQIADELKGITMPTAGISSLVTVNLEEAEQYLEPTA